MSLLCYMQVVPHRGGLPDPAGPLSLSLSPSEIESANAAVTTARQEQLTKTAGKRGPYLRLDNETRAEIGKYASESSDTAAARHFSKVLGKTLNRSTVHSLKKAYYVELSRKRKAEDDSAITSLPVKKRGRPLLLGEVSMRRCLLQSTVPFELQPGQRYRV